MRKIACIITLASVCCITGLFAGAVAENQAEPDYDALFVEAETLYNEQKYKELIELLAPIQNVRDDPSDYKGLSYYLLGKAYHNTKQYRQAEACYLEAINILEETLGSEHPAYALSLINLGELYSDLVDYMRAVAYYIEAKDVLER